MRSESYEKWVHGGGVNGLVCAVVVFIWWSIAFGFGMDGVSIWCTDANANFGDGKFGPT